MIGYSWEWTDTVETGSCNDSDFVLHCRTLISEYSQLCPAPVATPVKTKKRRSQRRRKNELVLDISPVLPWSGNVDEVYARELLDDARWPLCLDLRDSQFARTQGELALIERQISLARSLIEAKDRHALNKIYNLCEDRVLTLAQLREAYACDVYWFTTQYAKWKNEWSAAVEWWLWGLEDARQSREHYEYEKKHKRELRELKKRERDEARETENRQRRELRELERRQQREARERQKQQEKEQRQAEKLHRQTEKQEQERRLKEDVELELPYGITQPAYILKLQPSLAYIGKAKDNDERFAQHLRNLITMAEVYRANYEFDSRLVTLESVVSNLQVAESDLHNFFAPVSLFPGKQDKGWFHWTPAFDRLVAYHKEHGQLPPYTQWEDVFRPQEFNLSPCPN